MTDLNIGDVVMVKVKEDTALLHQGKEYTILDIKKNGEVVIDRGEVSGTNYGKATYNPERFYIVRKADA